MMLFFLLANSEIAQYRRRLVRSGLEEKNKNNEALQEFPLSPQLNVYTSDTKNTRLGSYLAY